MISANKRPENGSLGNVTRFPDLSNVCRPSSELLRHAPPRSQPSRGSVVDNEPKVRFGLFAALIVLFTMGLSSCKIYSFKDVSIPPQVKTIHIGYIENRARLVNPLLAPQLNDQLRQKINQQASKLSQRQDPGADYDVSGSITDYNYTTAGVSNQQAASNQLNVTVHIIFKNNLDPTGKTVAPADFEADVTRNFLFAANLSIPDAEQQLLPKIVSNMTDEIFNKLFSNW